MKKFLTRQRRHSISIVRYPSLSKQKPPFRISLVQVSKIQGECTSFGDFPVVNDFQKVAPRRLACRHAQSIKSAVPSSGPKNRISSLPSRSTISSLIPGDWPLIRRSKTESTYFLKQVDGTASMSGKMVPFEPPSGMSLFFEACVEARA